MKLSITYFGMFAELTGRETEQLELSGSIGDFKQWLFETYPEFEEKELRIAQNAELVDDQTPIDGTQLAVLPPFAGG